MAKPPQRSGAAEKATGVRRTPAAQRHRTRKGAPGIVDVALRAEVSPATVSRFFNHPDMLHPRTRSRIEKAASELGYIRDRLAGTLHNRRSGTIGLIVPTIDNAIFAELIEAFSACLQRNDLTTLVASHNYDLDLEVAIVRSLLERRIDGVVLVGHDHANAALAMLDTRAVPVVSVWNYRAASTLCCIGADNRAAARTVTEHVIGFGHRDIAFLFPTTRHNDRARDRRQGARDALEHAGITLQPQRWHTCPYHIASAKALTAKLLEHHAPTAIVCANDIIAQGAVYAAQSARLAVPTDLSIVGIGDFRGSESMNPPLTTMRLPARRTGEMAAEKMIRCTRTQRGESDGQIEASVAIDAELLIRGSTAAPRPVCG